MTVTEDMISPYNIQMGKIVAQQLNQRKYKFDCDKLVPNLQDKQLYVVHGTNLKLYIELGMKVKKIHKVLSFEQSPWMKEYIEKNMKLRAAAKNDFEKEFYKAANTNVFGKTMENVRKRSNIKLFNAKHEETCRKSLIKKISDLRIKNITIFDENLGAIEKKKQTVTINKPIYLGACILDLSKVLMYNFHYNHIYKKYDYRDVKLLFTDTDSLCYNIKTADVYEDMKADMNLYDTSHYPKSHPLYSTENKKVIGKFKDETNSKPISMVAAVKPKMYSFECGGKEVKKAKGISKAVVSKNTSFQQYYDCIMNNSITKATQHNFRTFKHAVHNIKQEKLALTPIDTKRYVLDDGVHTYAYGHYKISELNNGDN